MIRYKDKIFPEYFIDPVTAVITNSKGEIQRTYIKGGRPKFKKMSIHQIQVHTNLGYKFGMDIHHLDENKLNNSLSNLVYLTRSEHTTLHNKERTFSEETKNKMSEAAKGNKNMLGKHHSEESKQKMSEAAKGRNKDRIWVNNGVIAKRVKCDDIPTGFIRGRLKKINSDFLKFCYEGFKKNDPKFPKEWTLDDYEKYTEECNRILEKENEEKTF